MSEEDDCDSTCPRCDHCVDETWTVVTKLSKNGSPVSEEEWCESCYDEHAFYCHISDFNFSSAAFTQAEDRDGDSICREYVVIKKWVKTAEREANSGDYAVFISPDDLSQENTEASKNVKEGKMAFVDFYWRLPTKGKKSPTPSNPRILVLMQEDGKEVDSESNSGVAEIVNKTTARAKEAGADIGDNNTLNVYTRLQLIADKHLPVEYKL